MTTAREKELEKKITELEKQLARLKNNVKKQRFGLAWMDVPEAFDDDVENKLPILKEVPEKAIINDDDKPTHILIEGDNYHALTCLNYTHKEKIDVIYIDPPYNLGKGVFRYKDKRLIDKYPDGTPVPEDHPFRHSYWLSFMNKRLGLCKSLLRRTGVIFISIDEVELGQMKLLCDSMFREKNLIGITVRVSNSAKNNTNHISITHDYALVYARNKQEIESNWQVPKNNYAEFQQIARRLQRMNSDNEEIQKELRILTKYPRFYDFDHYYYCDKVGVYRTDNPGGVENGNYDTEIMHPLTQKPCKKPSGGWRYNDDKIKEMLEKDLWHFGEDETSIPAPKRYLKDYLFQKPTGIHFFDSQNDAKLLKKMGLDFKFPKPKEYVKMLVRMACPKDGIVLDFFAGSGTTTHAVMDLNEEDGSFIQTILVTNDENGICSEVCYPRLKNIIKGYKNTDNNLFVEGLGGSLKKYTIGFVGENNILTATDKDKIELAHQAGDLLSIAENTLYKVEENDFWQVYENSERYTAVYFREELDKFDKFVGMVEKLEWPVTIYVFSWGDEEFVEDFEHIDGVKVKTIPLPILEIYKSIYNLG